MMAYLLHSSLLLAGFTVFYWLLLRHETFYSLNRWLILLSIGLSLSLPLLKMPSSMSFRPVEHAEQTLIATLDLPLVDVIPEEAATAAVTPSVKEPALAKKQSSWLSQVTFLDIVFYLYYLGVVIFAIVFFMQLIVLIARRSTLNTVSVGKYSIVELVKDHEPYSFLHTIFINPSNYDENTYQHIFEHEKIHVDQRHFIDKLLAEFLVIVFWFNPFVWLLRSTLGKNLEFLTDHSLIKNGLSKENYQLSLLKVSTSNKPFNLTTSYNNSFLKNRIMMMNSKRSSLTSSWKYLFIAPMFLFSAMSLNAVYNVTTDTFAQADSPIVEKKDEAKSEKKKVEAKVKPKTKTNTKPANITKDKSAYYPKKKSTSQALTTPGVSKNQDVKRIEINLPDMRGFEASQVANVIVRRGNTQKIVVEGTDEALALINRDLKNGIWHIMTKDHDYKSSKQNKRLNIIITVPQLEHIGCSGAANVKGEDFFKLDDGITLACSGAGNIDFQFESYSTHCAISGAGNINIEGRTGRLFAAISGSGNIYGNDFDAKEGEFRISGAGNITTGVKDRLDVIISGSGTVQYRGNPRISKKISGHGVIKQI